MPLGLLTHMANGKLYTSGNGNVISTVRKQTVEQRASRLTQRHLPSVRAMVKHVKTRQIQQFNTRLPSFFRACVRVIHNFYE